DNMTLQTETLSNQRAKARRATIAEDTPVVDGAIGIIAVASGEGIAAALESMGAHITVSGGQSMNPSTEDLLDAVRRLPVNQVIILPNNKNVIMTANLIDSLTDKAVRVVPSRSIPQGLAALARFSRETPLDDNTSRMTTALGDAHTIEITHAVHAANLNGIVVADGDLLALVDGEIIAAGSALDAIVTETMHALESAEPELLTVFTGEDATPDATASIERLATSIFPDAEIEIVEGDQPVYPYIIAVE
ncbi:MAG TPA: hypothetical protein VNZ55_04960, partial [Thermomicrobiales bacterium]|nr:hypothetical protein [Thermomicrobiales bacterium]